MSRTSRSQLHQWLLVALAELGGSAPRAQVLKYIDAQFGHQLTEEDRKKQQPKSDSARVSNQSMWENAVSWERKTLVDNGLIAQAPRGGPWTLTPSGLVAARRFVGDDDSVADPLSRFRPKDSSDYLARISSRVLTKRRHHEYIIRDFGSWLAGRGFTPATDVHPRDLVVLDPNGAHWLVEVKVVYDGDATGAVRSALAQLLMYSHFLYKSPPLLMALFSESIGDLYCEFLCSHGIESVWWSEGQWKGSAGATAAGLV
ncbi:MAG: hypothetical protein JWO67_2649 [Streptosporangiaceae bacterium]|nr:hypothetical protein [Streptosporangiaceae bacterium]